MDKQEITQAVEKWLEEAAHYGEMNAAKKNELGEHFWLGREHALRELRLLLSKEATK